MRRRSPPRVHLNGARTTRLLTVGIIVVGLLFIASVGWSTWQNREDIDANAESIGIQQQICEEVSRQRLIDNRQIRVPLRVSLLVEAAVLETAAQNPVNRGRIARFYRDRAVLLRKYADNVNLAAPIDCEEEP